ncbi:MAG: gluconate 2-dehydrogenase subunit 3 family protein [Myxococcota bacterium]|nr:gluconate 2-dehydrogenase subunit 3 family protein [Myxococcota bacterium]
MPSRRHLLLGGLSLATAAGLGSVLWAHRPPQQWLDSPFLGATPRATLVAALEVLLPEPARAPELAAGVDSFLATDDPAVAEQLRLALLVLEHGAGLRAFSRMPLAQRTQVLLDWESSELVLRRQIFQALRKTAVFTFFADPGQWSVMGYDGPWVGAQ